MTVKVTLGDMTLAQATKTDFETQKIIEVENNLYFDKSLLSDQMLTMHGAGQQYTCPIKKGTCDYYDALNQDGEVIEENVSWIYEKLDNSLFSHIQGKMAFDSSKVTIERS